MAAAIWIVVYCAVWSTGQGFSTNFVMDGWQLVPYPILSRHPLSSVWYLHIQPPLWNLIIGGLGRWSPVSIAISLQLFSLALGALLAGTLASLLVRIDVPRRFAIAIALFATLNPPVLRLAFDAQYELFVAVGIAIVLWAVAAPPSTRPAYRFMIISVAGTVIAMTRSLYHPLWLLLLLTPVAWRARALVSRRVLAAMALVPLISIGGWMLKNEIIFHEATLSTWTGMNLQKAISPTFSRDKLLRLAAKGAISDVSVVGPFQAYANYGAAAPACSPVHRDPAVSVEQSTRPIVGFDGKAFFPANFNYECFIPVYEIAGDDAVYLATHYPRRWFTGRLWSARAWFGSGSINERSSSILLRGLDNLYGVARLDLPAPVVSSEGWQSRGFLVALEEDDASWLVVGCTVLLVGAGLHQVLRRVGRKRGGPRANVMIVAAFILTWTFAVGIAGELGEQARFRTMIDPFTIPLGIVAAASIVQSLRARRSGRTITSSAPMS